MIAYSTTFPCSIPHLGPFQSVATSQGTGDIRYKAAREGAPYSLVSYIPCPYLCVRVEWALFSFPPLEFRPLRFLFGRNV